MKTAIIGSRNITDIDIGSRLPDGTDEIVSGGAKGIDTCAAVYAETHGLKLTVFLPEYEKYGRAAPIVRNKQIAEYADCGVAFWDGKSRGTASTISLFKKSGKPIEVIIIE